MKHLLVCFHGSASSGTGILFESFGAVHVGVPGGVGCRMSALWLQKVGLLRAFMLEIHSCFDSAVSLPFSVTGILDIPVASV